MRLSALPRDLRSLGHRLARLTPRRLAHLAAMAWFAGVFYRRTLGGRRARSLAFVPPEAWPGSAERGAAIVKGQFALAGQTIEAPDDPFRAPGASAGWTAELHGFGWLRDLHTVGGGAARRRARELVACWLDREDRWHPLTWRADVLAARLVNWLTYAEYLFGPDEQADPAPLLRSLARQTAHLRRVAPLMDPGTDRLAVVRALVYAALCLPAEARRLPRWLALLAQEVEGEVAADGGHASRSPGVQFAVLSALVELRAALREADATVPEALQNAIDRMAPMVRFFRHGDGGLALFNDSNEDEGWLIDVVLTRAEARGKPLAAAPHVGFQRASANRTLLVMDTGPLPPPGYDAHAHAGTLSFELSVGRQRVVVNCGAYCGVREDWRVAQRATAAHSTVTIDDLNSAEILGDGLIGVRPRIVKVDRRESDGNVWIDAGIADYGGIAGLVHMRRLYLAASGGDLRGEDTVSGRAPRKFVVRFHLHPAVKASLSQDGESVLLRLADGGGWRLRASGGVASLQESVYLGVRGETRRTEQVVISAATQGAEAQVKWALTRLSADG